MEITLELDLVLDNELVLELETEPCLEKMLELELLNCLLDLFSAGGGFMAADDEWGGGR